jgi:D-glycero-D-manno-heptose 1,7-bisphosphate phosphatase
MNAPPSAPPVFLDRDGTLIVEKEYLSDPGQVRIEQGVAQALKMLQDAGHPLIVVSNQSGVGRGMFMAADVLRVNARVAELLRADGVQVLAWYYCPHAPETACDCRKPLPGMALAASAEWGVTLEGSYVIGDKRSDVEMADAIGGTGILVTSGHGQHDLDWARRQARPVFERLRDAAAYVLACDASTRLRSLEDVAEPSRSRIKS